MSEQDLNNNNETYPEMPANDMSGVSGGGLVGKSTIKDVIDSAAGINPTRFWIVMMVGLIIGLASAIIFGGGYLVEQSKTKDNEIVKLRQELKDCPKNAIKDLKEQQQTIEDLKYGVLYNRDRIQEIKVEKVEDVQTLRNMNKKLKEITTD